MNPNQSDPVIDEIRARRHEISARFGHDPARLVAYYMELQAQYGDRLMEPVTTSPSDDVTRSDRELAGEQCRS
jgi:hypothetical protein